MLWPGGDQVVERAALAEQGMGSGRDGVGLEVTVHAEALAGGAEPGEQDDGVEPQEPVAPLRVGDAHRGEAQAEAQVLGRLSGISCEGGRLHMIRQRPL